MPRLPLAALLLAGCIGNKADDTALTDDSTADDSAADGALIIDLETSLGPIAVELDAAHAPITVENFLAYVDDGFYDGDDGAGATTFHRVVSGFVIQGGGYTPEGALKNTLDPIALESDNGLSNLRGTIAMARTNVPDSATSQFYFNLVDNTFLDYDGAGSPGYAVFGAIVEGLDTMDDIAAVQTNAQDQPVEDVVITAAGRR